MRHVAAKHEAKNQAGVHCSSRLVRKRQWQVMVDEATKEAEEKKKRKKKVEAKAWHEHQKKECQDSTTTVPRTLNLFQLLERGCLHKIPSASLSCCTAHYVRSQSWASLDWAFSFAVGCWRFLMALASVCWNLQTGFVAVLCLRHGSGVCAVTFSAAAMRCRH